MVKLVMALVFAAIAALVIMLGGFLHEARLGTIALRSLGGFLVAGWLVYIIVFALEAKGIVGFDKPLAPMPEAGEDGAADAPAEGAGDGEAAEDGGQGEAGETAAPAGEPAPGFTPLAAQNLQHITSPPES